MAMQTEGRWSSRRLFRLGALMASVEVGVVVESGWAREPLALAQWSAFWSLLLP